MAKTDKAERQPESVEDVRKKAAKRKLDPARLAKVAKVAAAATNNPRFEFSRSKSAVDGLPIHYFRVAGESVVGILCPPDQEIWKGVTYKLVQDDDTIVRLPGNRRLTKAIEKADALYCRVKITYLGKLNTKFGGHYEKVYTIEQAPKDHTLSVSGRRLIEQAAAEAKARKSGK
jgi:hypothetical protein